MRVGTPEWEAAVEAALEAVLDGMSYRAAAREWPVSVTTLRGRVRARGLRFATLDRWLPGLTVRREPSAALTVPPLE